MSAQEVTLPLERYDELRARARPVPEATPAPPLPFALEAVELDVRAGRASARVAQKLTLALYSDDWQSLSLPATGSITAARLGTLAGRLKADDAGVQLVVRGKGRHVVHVESVVPLDEDETAARVTRTLSLAIPRAAAISGSLSTDESDLEEVRIAAGGLPRGPAANARRLEFVAEPGGTLSLQLLGRARALDRAQLPLKCRAVAATLAEVGRTRTRLTAWIRSEILSGRLESLELALPGGFEVTGVKPAELGWEVKAGQLLVTPAAPAERTLELSVELAGEPQLTLDAPLVEPRGCSSSSLLSAVAVTADGFAEVVDPGSGRRAETADLDGLPTAALPAGAAYFVVRDKARAPRWSVTWSEGANVLGAQVDRLLVNLASGRAGRAGYELWAVVRATGATDVVLMPPPGLELLALERDGVPVSPGASEHGLVVPLASGGGPQVVHVLGLVELRIPAEGELAIPLPASSAPIARVEVVAALPADRAYALAREDQRGRTVGVPISRARAVDRAAKGLAALAAHHSSRVGDGGQAVAGAGAVEILQAAWSALVNKPGPLIIRVKPRRQKEEWF